MPCDIHVLIALAEVLNCKVDDIINPDYVFSDPMLKKEKAIIKKKKERKRFREIQK